MDWIAHCEAFLGLLKKAEFTDGEARPLGPDEAFGRLTRAASNLRAAGGILFCAGNGASASLASHFAADAGKNGRLRAMVFTDPALLTALGNDISFEQVFAEPLRRHGGPGDMLLAVSSSGASPNILAALKAAREIGLFSATFTSLRPDNPARARGDLNVYAPADGYGDAESAHAFLLHHWLDILAGKIHG